ncbi:MAG: FmdB family zinc ribbon protein [Candidatus Omnitrophota bacterium]|jgi:putative FmdB family regulatory protein
MPTYDYKCEKCGHKFEKFQSIKDEALKECPECEGPVKRLIGTGAGIIFKGKGFYQTDYKGTCPGNNNTSKKDDKSPVCGASCDCPHKK